MCKRIKWKGHRDVQRKRTHGFLDFDTIPRRQHRKIQMDRKKSNKSKDASRFFMEWIIFRAGKK